MTTDTVVHATLPQPFEQMRTPKPCEHLDCHAGTLVPVNGRPDGSPRPVYVAQHGAFGYLTLAGQVTGTPVWLTLDEAQTAIRLHRDDREAARAAHRAARIAANVEVTHLYCSASGGRRGEANTTHHLVPKGTSATAPRAMVCAYCGDTEQALRDAAVQRRIDAQREHEQELRDEDRLNGDVIHRTW